MRAPASSTRRRIGGDAGQAGPASAVLDHDQLVETMEQHGVHVHEVDGDDAAGLRR
jgi:N-dimethylarginine dimethylaminohydrolase